MNVNRLRSVARTLLRPVLRGWPDEGRLLVQGPYLRKMLARAGRPALVLNAGSGEGLFSRLLFSLPNVRLVLEIDLSLGDNPQLRASSRQKIAAGALTAIPARSGIFDLVLCTEVLEHIDDDTSALAELRRVLAPEGSLIVTVPTLNSPYDPNHVRTGYDAEYLCNAIRSLGLEIVKIDYCMHAAFKTLMRMVRRHERVPRSLIWLLALTDRFFAFGRPMDVMILSRLPAETHVPLHGGRREAKSVAPRTAVSSAASD